MKKTKYIVTKAFISTAMLVAFFVVHTPAHAETTLFGKVGNTIKQTINTDKGNATENRDQRNKILRQKFAAIPSPSSKEIFVNDLYVSMSNYKNIRDRIANKSSQEAHLGKDTSAVDPALFNVDTSLDIATQTVDALATSMLDGSISDPSATITTDMAARSIRSVRFFLQDALDALQKVGQ